MKTINPKLIASQINKCYLDYDPSWPVSDEGRINGFKYYIEHSAGLKLDFIPQIKDGKYGYELKQVEIVDDKRYTMFLIKYSS